MILARAGLVVLLVAAGVRSGYAQAAARYAGGGGGLVQPAGTFGDVEKLGWHLFATAAGKVSGTLGFMIDAVFGQVSHKEDVPGHSRLSGVTANLALFLSGAEARVRPLVFAGAGLYRASVYVPGFGSSRATELAWDGGAAVLIPAGGGRRLIVTARFVSVRTAPEATSFVPVSVGVVFPIGFP